MKLYNPCFAPVIIQFLQNNSDDLLLVVNCTNHGNNVYKDDGLIIGREYPFSNIRILGWEDRYAVVKGYADMQPTALHIGMT